MGILIFTLFVVGSTGLVTSYVHYYFKKANAKRYDTL